jgi:hypothetical protein
MRGRLERIVSAHLFPRQVKFFVSCGAIPQVEVDQALVWNSDLLGDRLEVVNRILIQANSDLLFELRSIGILLGFGKIVFFAHRVTYQYCRDSMAVAFLAEMIRIVLLLLR